MFIIDQKVVLFLQVLLVVGLPMAIWRMMPFGHLFPLPIIQILAGILLGPSIFGAMMPDAFAFFFRKEVLAGVDTLANVALVLFVFLAGCELDRQILKRSAGLVVQIGVAGVLLPWIAGTMAAWALLLYMPATGIIGELNRPTIYAVSFGLCMAVTALPVLVVVLRELGFNQKPIGTIALAVGGVDDALLWSSLTVLLPFAVGKGNILSAFLVAVGGAVLTIVLLVYVISPLLQRLVDRGAPERWLISLAILTLFLFASINEATQLHAAIGAFLTGLLLPDKIRELCEDRFDVPVTLLLLPFLFLATGLKTSFSFTDATVWVVVAVALLVCIGGKFVGVTLPAYLKGESAPFSITLGILMQCKGLMEIVVVTVLYQRGVFGSVTFSALVLVALISTALTIPLARLSERRFGDAATRARETEVVEVTVAAPEPVPETQAVPEPRPLGQLVLEGGAVPITKPEVVIGRHSQDDIRISDVRVSRHHARLTAGPAGFEIQNLTAVRSEPNPMAINGVETERAALRDGDTISLGGVTFQFKAA